MDDRVASWDAACKAEVSPDAQAEACGYSLGTVALGRQRGSRSFQVGGVATSAGAARLTVGSGVVEDRVSPHTRTAGS